MLRYAICDRRLFAGDDTARQAAVVRQASQLANEGVDYFQLREKDLPIAELVRLAGAVRDAVAGSGMRVVLNGPAELASELSLGAHARADTVCPLGPAAYVSASCHMLQDVEAWKAHASLLLFGPVFAKQVAGAFVQEGVGLARLQQACLLAAPTPVCALGGVDAQRAVHCVRAGAAGVAGIRLFLR